LAEALDFEDATALDAWLLNPEFKAPWDAFIRNLEQFRDDKGRLGRAHPPAKIQQTILKGSSKGSTKYELNEVMDFTGCERLDYEAFAFYRVYLLNTKDKSGAFYRSGLSENEIYKRIFLVYRRVLHSQTPFKRRRGKNDEPPEPASQCGYCRLAKKHRVE
jgi:hypothetical protein